MIYDNTDLIFNKLLKFYNHNDTYYIIKIFSRKKDVIENGEEDIFQNIYGRANERLITLFYIKNKEDYEKYVKIAKYLVDHIPYTRAYFNVNPKSEIKTMVNLNNEVTQMINKKLYEESPNLVSWIHTLPYSILSRAESNLNRDYNWIVLNVDINDSRYKHNAENISIAYYRFIAEIEELNLDGYNIEYFEYKTPKGKHLLLNHRYASYFKKPGGELTKYYNDLINLEGVEEKINAAALLYANIK